MQAHRQRRSRPAAPAQTAGLNSRSLKLFKHGLHFHAAGQAAAAIAAFEAVVADSPGHIEALHNLAVINGIAGRHAAAVTAWERVLQLQPGAAAITINLAKALAAADRLGCAAALLTKACHLHPGDAGLLALHASILLRLGQPELAAGALFMLLDLQPDDASAHRELSRAFSAMDKLDPALGSCLAAIRLAPDHANITDLSAILIGLGRYAEALDASDHAVALKPGSFTALNNRAIALEGLGRFEDAVAAGRHAVALAPDDPIAHHNLAATLLSLGHLTHEAWELYEWRLRLNGDTAWLFSHPRWTDADLAGKTVLLHAEQGMGDTLQFVRYAGLLAARGARVVLAAQAPLVRLLQSVAGVHQVVAVGAALPAHDIICPLLSLPLAFGTTLATIPGGAPYIAADPQLAAVWRLPPSGSLRIGLAWAGGALFVDDRQRSMALADLAPLGGVEGVEFHSLQKSEASRPPEALPPGLALIDRMAAVQDFADTAALIDGLDLVITVDTAVAHLAAAMGKPVWLLSRHRGCWRWLRDRSDSPWYPTMRLYRQAQPRDWRGVVDTLCGDLRALRMGSPPGPA